MRYKKLLRISCGISFVLFIVGVIFFIYAETMELNYTNYKILYQSISAWITLLSFVALSISTILYFWGEKILIMWNCLVQWQDKINNMEYKKALKLILLLSILGVGVGFILISSQLLDWCRGIFYCDAKILDEVVTQPLVLFSASVFFLSSFLYFLHEEVFHSWIRFTKWYIPLAGIAILLSLRSHGGWGVGNIFATELVTMWTAGLFFILSLLIIIYKAISIRRKKKLL